MQNSMRQREGSKVVVCHVRSRLTAAGQYTTALPRLRAAPALAPCWLAPPFSTPSKLPSVQASNNNLDANKREMTWYV